MTLPPRYRYALLGMGLGVGAPAGASLLRVLTQFNGDWLSTLTLEWRSASFYYLYMTFGTIIAFGLFGLAVGRRNEALSDLSETDGLTGLLNHRTLQAKLAEEMERSDRYHTPVTCLMLDIDDFKSINDRFGHPFGDRVLRRTGELIGKAIRRTDILGRYGGEEFLVIMPATNNEVALTLANRILEVVRKEKYSVSNQSIGVTLSIGLAMYPDLEVGVKTKNALLSAADQALYKAKRGGKNKVVVWSVATPQIHAL